MYTGLYVRQRGGLTIVVIAHASAHLSNASIPLPSDALPLAILAVAHSLVAVALLAFDWKTWRLVNQPVFGAADAVGYSRKGAC